MMRPSSTPISETRVLEVVMLSASYGSLRVLRDISFGVAEGDKIAIIGANGAGKSTLLNALSGVVRPAAEQIVFCGRPILGLPPHRIARLGLLQVPEGRQIVDPLSVEENLAIGTLAARDRKGDSRADLHRVFDVFPRLAERRKQEAGSLSGGEQQMLAIGRALMGRPRILLLDEPSLGLSPLMADTVFAALVRLNHEGLTLVLVEQNARRALEMTDFAFVLEQGVLVHQGPSATLLNDPQIIAHYLGQAQP
jgi:branched-chain amino acid transport system ATP-binding protein